MTNKDHWERVYTHKAAEAVSWFQPHADTSLRLIGASAMPRSGALIDVGGGASTLVDDLLEAGYQDLSVLDLSASALAAAGKRLGARASLVRWIEADITQVELPRQVYDLWHDRAVFHFLTTETDRQAYVRQVRQAVKPGGHVIVASFAEDGPSQCSGLPVVRYSPDALHAEFGAPFTLLSHEEDVHHTPFGTVQKFVYCFCRTAHA
ncbi:class I SAM-dependent methyltransferase [Leptothrix discophora]|uniref:Class I SAM-dependent methyltransferase n=1 Tax=Leptothrix discophora TaxID=89 RepID=A0ABT9G1N7_LEPDI|nr:class I SAM-dependent methyltransferase [Leptothrix discophora]MDP4300403.1 class I SAM-dependent methyltransferase [Leptothrix discophora]